MGNENSVCEENEDNIKREELIYFARLKEFCNAGCNRCNDEELKNQFTQVCKDASKYFILKKNFDADKSKIIFKELKKSWTVLRTRLFFCIGSSYDYFESNDYVITNLITFCNTQKAIIEYFRKQYDPSNEEICKQMAKSQKTIEEIEQEIDKLGI